MLRPKHGRNVTAVVVGHGFTNHVRKPFVFRILERLARQHTVIAVHRARQHAATLGFSMGGTVALMRALRGRMAEPLRTIPPSPVEVVDRIAPTPVLLVHGNEDHCVPGAKRPDRHRERLAV